MVNCQEGKLKYITAIDVINIAPHLYLLFMMFSTFWNFHIMQQIFERNRPGLIMDYVPHYLVIALKSIEITEDVIDCCCVITASQNFLGRSSN